MAAPVLAPLAPNMSQSVAIPEPCVTASYGSRRCAMLSPAAAVSYGPPMPLNSALGDIAHVIQLAIAPVFLLTAVGTLLNVLTSRLGRTVDRRRVLVAALPQLDAALAADARAELRFNERRTRLIYLSISLAVMCALLICL